MARAIALRPDFTAAELRAWRGGARTRPRRVAFWRWRRSATAARARRRPGLAPSRCRSGWTGWCGSTPRGGTGCATARHPALGTAGPARYASTYIFGAACPQDGKGAALVLPLCNTAAMTLQLAGISQMVVPSRHAVLLRDQAGWHLSGEVAVPANMTLLPLPPKCPELNVIGNI